VCLNGENGHRHGLIGCSPDLEVAGWAVREMAVAGSEVLGEAGMAEEVRAVGVTAEEDSVAEVMAVAGKVGEATVEVDLEAAARQRIDILVVNLM
jgi:hypothetical protein